jgi:hypothetical protein
MCVPGSRRSNVGRIADVKKLLILAILVALGFVAAKRLREA